MAEQLRTDIENLPTDGTPCLVGTIKGEVLISKYVAPTLHCPTGRWAGMASSDWPVVWAPVPAHPFAAARRVLLSGERVKA